MKKTAVKQDFLEELFCATYGEEDFETAVEDFESEEDAEEGEEEFEGEEEVEAYLEKHREDSPLLKEAWDTDLWNNSVTELVRQCYEQHGVLNLTSLTSVLADWQEDWEAM